MVKTDLDPALLAAYMDTDYMVSDDPPLRLRIGERNDDARILLASFNVSTAAFITAWNPGSRRLTDEENEDRQAELLTEIEQRRLNYLVGVGEGKDWQEYSYLVLGVSREDATALGRQFEQNAYVFLEIDGVPELVTLN